jgi:hydrogenase maturation protein HypF
MAPARRLLRVAGAVQGVGFRPWAARAARSLGLAGSVRNAAAGVEIEIEGEPAAIDRFRAALRDDPPRAARIDAVRDADAPPRGAAGFAIAASDATYLDAAGASIPLDRALCEACLAELFDPRSRRHRFAFGHCAECGPRASVLRALPWDRARTTLAAFEPCAACQREYDDPADRRCHAESIACAACGPRLRARRPDGATLGGDPIECAAAALRDGAIVAVLGGGGYHLAVDAAQPAAIARLRERKRRPAKPFGLLVPDLAAARALAVLGAGDEALLAGPEHALVVAPRRDDAALDPAIAPGLRDVGLALPFAPVEWLLLFAPGSAPPRDAPRFRALVWTSANPSGEPTLADPDDLRALAGVADLLLDHDRRVARPNDDPVFRSAPGGAIPIRLSRGTAPLAFPLPGGLVADEPILAVGSDLKAAPAIAAGGRVVLAESVGDLGTVAAADAWRARAADLARHLGVSPRRAVHDLHPDSIGRVLAAERGRATLAVAHHHAHAVACLVEHGRSGPVLALALDGFGFGTDESAWGGELLWADLARFERVAHLEPVALPGGDAAAREPWRMAAAWLDRARATPPRAWLARRDPAHLAAVRALAARGRPLTTSCGRLFDAVGSLLDCGDVASHEGEVAARLEALASAASEAPRTAPHAAAARAIECASLVRAVAEGALRGADRAALARAFHDALADRLAAAAVAHARALAIGAVALTGGCFQNRLLSERVAAALTAAGIEALRHRALPPGDGAIAVGQATIAAARPWRA